MKCECDVLFYLGMFLHTKINHWNQVISMYELERSLFCLLYRCKEEIHSETELTIFTQPLRSGRIWRKVNF